MAEHELKCWIPYFEAILSGKKRFELRKDDRGFREWDVLYLKEYDDASDRYTGRSLRTWVSYVMRASDLGGLCCGYVVLSIVEPIETSDA